MNYIDYESMYTLPLYRPPSEAYSLIIQATYGCSHNKCSFCTMYKTKKYVVKPIDEIKNDIDAFRIHLSYVKRIFIADGDAFSMPTDMLIEMLGYIKKKFPECERISIYASPKSVLEKTDEELNLIKSAGLELVYLGIESGDSKTLKSIRKEIDSDGMIEVCKRLKNAKFTLSVTLIAGINGQNSWREHAVNSGKLISQIEPDYLGILTLIISRGCELYNKLRVGEFVEATSKDILNEIKVIIENIDVKKPLIFRANHASNYLNLSGTFPEDKRFLLDEINLALKTADGFEKKYRRL